MQESMEGLVHIRSVEYGVNDIQNKALQRLIYLKRTSTNRGQ